MRVGRGAIAGVSLAAVIILIGCGAGQERPDTDFSARAQQGRQAYMALGCVDCHGENLEGKRSGPSLTGIADHWHQDSLIAYLKDPPAMIKTSPRLAYKAEQYPIAMPGFAAKADEETLAQIAAFLLES